MISLKYPIKLVYKENLNELYGFETEIGTYKKAWWADGLTIGTVSELTAHDISKTEGIRLSECLRCDTYAWVCEIIWVSLFSVQTTIVFHIVEGEVHHPSRTAIVTCNNSQHIICCDIDRLLTSRSLDHTDIHIPNLEIYIISFLQQGHPINMYTDKTSIHSYMNSLVKTLVWYQFLDDKKATEISPFKWDHLPCETILLQVYKCLIHL